MALTYLFLPAELWEGFSKPGIISYADKDISKGTLMIQGVSEVGGGRRDKEPSREGVRI